MKELFSERFIQIRQERGLTQKQMADQYGILVPTVRLMDECSLRETEYRILLYGKQVLAAGQSVNSMEEISRDLERVVLENYDQILNRQIVAQLVEIVYKKSPAVTENIVPDKVSYRYLEKVVAALIKKKCPINRLGILLSI